MFRIPQIGIIYGSRSCEHEVSVISALQLYRHVDRRKYDVLLIYISQQGEWFVGEPLANINTYRPAFKPDTRGLTRVVPDLTARSGALLALKHNGLYRGDRVEIVARLDCAIPVMHGLHGEDGTLQGVLEMMDIPYTSTGVAGSSVGMDKILMKKIFKGFGFPVLPGCAVTRGAWRARPEEIMNDIEKELPYPVFVKPANLGSSIGVSRAATREELREALTLACTYDRRVLVEQGLNEPLEVNCSVRGFDEEAVASVVEMPVTFGRLLDFHKKYLEAGGAKGMASLRRVVPAPIGEELTQRVQKLSVDIFRALDCKGVVRVIYMLVPDTEELYITEINTIPGSLSFYLWNQSDPAISYPELIDRMIRSALEAHDQKNENNYAYRSDIFRNTSVGTKGTKGIKGTKE